MSISSKVLPALAAWLLAGAGAGGASEAQTPAAAPPDTAASRPTAQSEAGEPRASSPSSPSSPSNPEPAKTPDSDGGKERAPAATGKGSAKAPAREGGRSTSADTLQLQTATVTGDREQPKVMYIVPWKKPDIGDLSGKPMNSLLDEALAPVDRDEFKREVLYYQAVRADAAQNGAPGAARSSR